MFRELEKCTSTGPKTLTYGQFIELALTTSLLKRNINTFRKIRGVAKRRAPPKLETPWNCRLLSMKALIIETIDTHIKAPIKISTARSCRDFFFNQIDQIRMFIVETLINLLLYILYSNWTMGASHFRV